MVLIKTILDYINSRKIQQQSLVRRKKAASNKHWAAHDLQLQQVRSSVLLYAERPLACHLFTTAVATYQ